VKRHISSVIIDRWKDLRTTILLNLFRLKEIVQIIYENDYQFARPPEMPTLSATAGDGQVILTWDNRADKLTREPLLNNKNDFEGYKLFRAL
jgi:hypothetical protein